VFLPPDLTFLQSVNLTRMVTCRLNPLKVCLPVVAQNFAAVTRTYQLAYCYTVLQHNARFSMPVIYQDHRGYAVTRESTLLDTFFPFDPFVLCRSVDCYRCGMHHGLTWKILLFLSLIISCASFVHV
jgi:RNA polymerase I-specific transcription initiation factor RRN3